MIRVLVFDGAKAEKFFEMLYHGLVMRFHGQPSAQREKGFEDLRKEADALTALQSISVERGDDKLPTGDGDRKLQADRPAIVLLKQPVHALLKAYVEAASWKPGAAIDAVAASDFLSAAKEREDDWTAAREIAELAKQAAAVSAPLKLVEPAKVTSEAQTPAGE
jgi:hypothetical protein